MRGNIPQVTFDTQDVNKVTVPPFIFVWGTEQLGIAFMICLHQWVKGMIDPSVCSV